MPYFIDVIPTASARRVGCHSAGKVQLPRVRAIDLEKNNVVGLVLVLCCLVLSCAVLCCTVVCCAGLFC